MINNPKISIIIPVYNTDKYIEEALDSCVNQTYKNIEIICLDDCSTDNSVEIIKEYAKNDGRIKLIENKSNQGPGALRNQGLDISTGDYIMFLDSDDWYEDGLFEKLAKAIEENESINIIEFRFNLANSKTDKTTADWLNRGENGIRKVEDEDIMLCTSTCTKCWNKKFLIKSQLKFCENNRSGEEIPMHICGMLLAKEFYYLDFVGFNWRNNQQSLSRDPSKNKEFLSGVFVMINTLKNELIRLDLYNEQKCNQYASTVLKWHINEKFSFTKYYFDYYRKCQKLFNKWDIKKLKPFWKIVIKNSRIK